jgi:hypothetical protein
MGWIRLHRALMDHPIWTQLNPAVLKVAIYFLLNAKYRRAEWYDRTRMVDISAGSFITSNARAAIACGLSVQQIRDAFEHLERTQFATYLRTKRWTLVTINNWATYQSVPEDENTPENSFGTGKRTTVKEEKKKTKTCASPGGNALGNAPQLGTPTDAFEGTLFPCEPKSSGIHRVVPDRQEEWFEQWWAEYWLHRAKAPARRAFGKQVKTEARLQQVMAATAAQKQEMLSRQPQHRPHGATWLNDQRWQDEITDQQQQPKNDDYQEL